MLILALSYARKRSSILIYLIGLIDLIVNGRGAQHKAFQRQMRLDENVIEGKST
jgi:hypothetical protein